MTLLLVPACNREEKLVHEDAWKPADRNGDLADYRSKDQRSYLRHASFQQEDDRGICLEFKLRTRARYRILPYPSGSKDRRGAGYY